MCLLQENLELQHLIANSQNSLLENKERISILKNKVESSLNSPDLYQLCDFDYECQSNS